MSFTELKKRGQVAEVKLIFKAYAVAQEAFFSEYKKFATNKNKLGFISHPERMKIYFNKDEIPESISSKITPSAIPYVAKDSFRILGLHFTSKEEPEVWTINNSGEVIYYGNITIK